MIYILGDSHVSVFLGEDKLLPTYNEGDDWIKGAHPRTRLTRIGPYTAYNLINHPEVMKNILERVPVGSNLILSFGEIDCRNHILKHKNIRTVVRRYFEFLAGLRAYNLCILLPPPTGDSGIESVDSSMFLRNLITKEFNRECSRLAQIYGIETLTMFDALVNEDLETNLGKYYDGSHPRKEVLPVLLEQLWKN